MIERTHNRAEFSPRTRELTAQRAGFRCSFPNCERVTIGPNKHPDKSSNIGIAAHIYGAATSGGGPRGTGGLSKRELQSPQNAIWLCSNHASLIDKHRGEDYPPEKLIRYKELHEARMQHELSGIQTPSGWVDRMKIHSSPLFVDDIEFDFAKLTLIIGGNSIGKTSLCEWLVATTNVQYLERWEKIPIGKKRLSFEVDYNDPEPHTASVSFISDKHPEYKLDGITTNIPNASLKVIFPQYVHFSFDGEQNDLDLISNALNLHPYEVRALCEHIPTNGSGYVKSAWFEENDERCYMFAEVEGSELQPCCFRQLSDSQQDRILMELGIIAAIKFAEKNPTLLILDSGKSSGFWRFDKYWLKHYSDLLGSPMCKFQTVVSMIPERVDRTKSLWDGWKKIKLDGEPPNARIRTGIS